MFQEQALSCVLAGALTRERVSGACFRGKLRRVYRPLKGPSQPLFLFTYENLVIVFYSEPVKTKKNHCDQGHILQ